MKTNPLLILILAASLVPSLASGATGVPDPGNGDISFCVNGSTADHDTDANGETRFSGTIFGGGWTQASIAVYVSGAIVSGGGGPLLPYDINSPDSNGDLIVNLVDVGVFAADYLEYHFRSDLVDSVPGNPGIDLIDVGRFSAFVGDSCP